jgi:hypothetical protein
MIKLFNEKRIEDYFNQIDRSLKNEVDNYSDQNLVTLNVNQTTDMLFGRYEITIPKLEKDKTTTSITQESISGHQFPAGTTFQPGKMYEIDIANYRIPFTGDYELFKCLPTVFTYKAVEAELTRNSIIIKLTNWGIIRGNDKAIEDLKNLFLQYIGYIEEYLNAIKNDVDKYLPVLNLKIKSYLEERIKQAKIKFDSNDKLNPFK